MAQALPDDPDSYRDWRRPGADNNGVLKFFTI